MDACLRSKTQHVSSRRMQMTPQRINPGRQLAIPNRLTRGEITDCDWAGTALWNIPESLITVPSMSFERKFMKRGSSAKAGWLQRWHATTSTTAWKIFMVAHLRGCVRAPQVEKRGFYIVLEWKSNQKPAAVIVHVSPNRLARITICRASLQRSGE